jgi:hypothetical protein
MTREAWAGLNPRTRLVVVVGTVPGGASFSSWRSVGAQGSPPLTKRFVTTKPAARWTSHGDGWLRHFAHRARCGRGCRNMEITLVRCARSRPMVNDGTVAWAAIGPSRFRLGKALRLAAAAIVIVLASDRGEHVEHHRVESGEHAGRELVARRCCQLVGRSRVTTRTCRTSSWPRSLRQSASVRRDRRSTCSTSNKSPGLESANSRKSSGRASFAPLSFSTYVPTMLRPRSVANASTCSRARWESCS